MTETLRNALRARRTALALSQKQLAGQAGISRQTLIDLEAGTTVPSTAVSLRLARALGCGVDDLFWLEDPGADLEVDLAGSGDFIARGSDRDQSRPAMGAGRRVVLGEVGGRWIAHALPDDQPASLLTAADAVLAPERLGDQGAGDRLQPQGTGRARATPLRAPSESRENLLLVGCDPALGLLAARLRERHPGARLAWLHAASRPALEALARGEAHVAGSHLRDDLTHEFNVPEIRRIAPGRPMLVVNLARWEEGLVVQRGNPLGICGVEDLARPGLRLVNRPLGAGARGLLDRLLAEAGLTGERIQGYGVLASGHQAVAQAVALGAADVGVAVRGVARAQGLDFIPLEEERFDLVLPAELAVDPRIRRLLDTVDSPIFRRELGALPGYGVADTGHVVAEVKA